MTALGVLAVWVAASFLAGLVLAYLGYRRKTVRSKR